MPRSARMAKTIMWLRKGKLHQLRMGTLPHLLLPLFSRSHPLIIYYHRMFPSTFIEPTPFPVSNTLMILNPSLFSKLLVPHGINIQIQHQQTSTPWQFISENCSTLELSRPNQNQSSSDAYSNQSSSDANSNQSSSDAYSNQVLFWCLLKSSPILMPTQIKSYSDAPQIKSYSDAPQIKSYSDAPQI